MLVLSCLSMWVLLVSLVGTHNFGGCCLFPDESIGYFRSGTRGVLINERNFSERSEGY